jgi:hypothetical protein
VLGIATGQVALVATQPKLKLLPVSCHGSIQPRSIGMTGRKDPNRMRKGGGAEYHGCKDAVPSVAHLGKAACRTAVEHKMYESPLWRINSPPLSLSLSATTNNAATVTVTPIPTLSICPVQGRICSSNHNTRPWGVGWTKNVDHANQTLLGSHMYPSGYRIMDNKCGVYIDDEAR